MGTAQEKQFGDLSRVHDQWESLKHNDKIRQALVDDLFKMLAESNEENTRLQTEIETLKFHEGNFIIERKRLKEENDRVLHSLNASPFVLALIDGDSTLFDDNLVKKGAEGGHHAAQNLQDKLNKYAKELVGTQAKLQVVVRIYVNLTGLLRVYLDANIIPTSRVFQDFIVGFNRELPLVEFIDAGTDKEAADGKVKANLSLYWENEHCKHILLAGSADAGYVGFLRQFGAGDGQTKRLTLIESVPFPANFRDLSARFHVTKFDGLFRASKISIEGPSDQQPRPHVGSYASATARSPQIISVAPQTNISAGSLPKINYNKYGNRIDDPLPRFENSEYKMLEKERICPQFVLSRCSNPRCSFRHDQSRSFDELEENALLKVARSYPCQNGTKCADRDCLAGHQCAYGANCYHGDKCRFSSAMHRIDKTIAKVV